LKNFLVKQKKRKENKAHGRIETYGGVFNLIGKPEAILNRTEINVILFHISG
jgi:hypothetical protein